MPKRKLKNSVKLLGSFIIFLGLILILILIYPPLDNQPTGVGRVIDKNRNTTVQEVSMVRLIAAGDYIIHDGLYKSGYDAEANTYTFPTWTKYIADIVADSDIAVVNFEGTLAADLYGLSGYPLFNAPSEVLVPLKEAGFNVIGTANNHSLDTRLDGLVATINKIERDGFAQFGTHKEDTQEILVIEENNIKIAFLAYSYGFNGLEAQYSDEQIAQHLEVLDPVEIEKDIKRAEEIADVTVVYPHWGNEYQRQPNDSQVELAHKMVEWGADLVLGSHPHVLQPAESIQKDGLDKFIIYSMGNFISNQRLETLNNHYTEQGLMLEFELEKVGDGEVIIRDVLAHPTWVNKVLVGDKYQYSILPTQKFLEGGELVDTVDSSTLERIRNAHAEIVSHLGLE